MRFEDRKDAGRKLADKLKHYANTNAIVYALPRGGVVVAKEIAQSLQAPLDLVFAHKIGHPAHLEYATSAVSESGFFVPGEVDLTLFGADWLEQAKKHELEEMKRRRKLYLRDKPSYDLQDKVAIIVDDGIATGLTMEAGILELQSKHPKKIILAAPVSPKEIFSHLAKLVDEAICLELPPEGVFMGAVGAYYHAFNQVEDQEVIDLLDE